MAKTLSVIILAVWFGSTQAARTRIAMSASESTLISELAEAKPYGQKCTSKCGQTIVKGTTQSGVKVHFAIGDGVDYEPKVTECFKECAAPITGSVGCSLGYTKVARLKDGSGTASDRKLCCRVKSCTWKPAEGVWWEKHSSEDQLLPLQDTLGGVSAVPGKTCLCCKKKVYWGPDVNTDCKYAYGHKGRANNDEKHAFEDFFSLGLSGRIWKANCRKYCTHYPDYPMFLKTMTDKHWTAADPQASADEANAKLTLAINQAECLEISQDSKDERECNDAMDVGQIIENLDASIKLAETDRLSSLVDRSLLGKAWGKLTELRGPYMNKKLTDAFTKAAQLAEEGGPGLTDAVDALQGIVFEVDPDTCDANLLNACIAFLEAIEKKMSADRLAFD